MNTDRPPGWHNLTPRLFAEDAQSLVSFLKSVFLAEGEYADGRPSELRIGDSIIMVSDAEVRGSYSACLYVYVADLEATYARAISAGVEVIEELLQTPYGDRRAVVIDRWGNMWQIAQYQSA